MTQHFLVLVVIAKPEGLWQFFSFNNTDCFVRTLSLPSLPSAVRNDSKKDVIPAPN
jgi:hypothetical protein